MNKYRILLGFDTRARRLRYIITLVSLMKTDTLPIAIDALVSYLCNWATYPSIAQEFKGFTGVLTQTGRPQKAMAMQYIQLALALHLISKRNDNVSITNLGKYMDLVNSGNKSVLLTEEESLFCLLILLYFDTDILFQVLQQINEYPLKRLGHHLKVFYETTVSSVSDRIYLSTMLGTMERQILLPNERQFLERLGEDILPQRFNWLLDLGLVTYLGSQGKRFNTTQAEYILTEQGQILTSALMKYRESEFNTFHLFCTSAVFMDVLSSFKWIDQNSEVRMHFLRDIVNEVRQWR